MQFTQSSPRRRRGVILTAQGLDKLQHAIQHAQFEENLGNRYTLEALSERTGLSIDTVRRVFACESAVDKQTLKFCFRAFNLELEPSDFSSPESQNIEYQSLNETQGSQFVVPETKLVVNRHRQQAQYFIEDLGNGVTLEMVLIPGGSFVMGAPEEEEESTNNERPQHTVTVQPFCTGKYPVTQAQWRAVAALPQVNRELDSDPSGLKGVDRPVEQVSWYDAVEFCERLSQATGRDYRLPSEAKWEYACRAGTIAPFHFGETITTDLANYDGSYAYGAGSEGTYRGETTLVGNFEVANEFGLYDMHGNVWEWCADHWHDNYEEAPIDGRVWLTENESSSRLLRGGSWYDGPRNCRSAYRVHIVPDHRISYVGFRVVCSIRAENQSVPKVHSLSDALTTERSVDYTNG